MDRKIGTTRTETPGRSPAGPARPDPATGGEPPAGLDREEMIEAGVDYLTAACECGFESASGFRDAFVREFGRPPGAYHDR